MRFLSMIYLSRLFFLSLPRAEYGFWALLWSCFGYAALFNFGMGISAEKETASLSEKIILERGQRLEDYQYFLSTLLWAYLFCAGFILILTLLGFIYLPHLIHLEQPDYQNVFLIFGLGTALYFPLGLFADVLRGLQKTYLKNYIELFYLPLYFIGMSLTVKMGYGLRGMVWVALINLFLINGSFVVLVYKYLPHLNLSPKYFSWALLRKKMRFSLLAYIINLTRLLLKYTDQFLIGLILNLNVLASYHILIRISDVFQQIATQLHDALGPLAAHLHSDKQELAVYSIILQANRFIAILATPIYLLLMLELPSILNIWLELADPEVTQTGYILLTASFIYIVFRSSSTKILTMCGEVNLLAILAVFEICTNLLLSIFFARVMSLGIRGIALGTLVPTLIVTAYVIPLTCKFIMLESSEYFKQTMQGILLSMLSVFAMAYYIQKTLPVQNLKILLVHFMILTLTYLLIMSVYGLTPTEKKILNDLRKRLHKQLKQG